MRIDVLEILARDVGYGLDNHRHWCPASETYAPVEVLLRYVRQGWKLDDLVVTETHVFTSCLCTAIYFFVLRRDGMLIRMPVLTNPIVLRMVNNCRLTLKEAKRIDFRSPKLLAYQIGA